MSTYTNYDGTIFLAKNALKSNSYKYHPHKQLALWQKPCCWMASRSPVNSPLELGSFVLPWLTAPSQASVVKKLATSKSPTIPRLQPPQPYLDHQRSGEDVVTNDIKVALARFLPGEDVGLFMGGCNLPPVYWVVVSSNLGGDFKYVLFYFNFISIWGRFPFWLIFFQMGWNHQLEMFWHMFTPKIGGRWTHLTRAYFFFKTGLMKNHQLDNHGSVKNWCISNML